MSTIGGPEIITDGLILHLDAANKKSYPGSGTTWNDLSGNGYDGTLTNGPTFDSGNGGSIVFDGSNDYVEIPNNSGYATTSGSIEYWVNAVDQRGFILYGGTSTSQNFYILHGNSTSGFADESIGLFARNTSTLGYSSYYRNGESWLINEDWVQIVHTLDGISNKTYINGSSVSVTYVNPSISYTSTPSSTQTGFWLDTISTGALRIGGRYTASALPYKGKFSILRIYKDPLTDNDVLQNYNAVKSRFGL